MRAVIYARYSSDNQREASIEDQIEVCRSRIDAEGWNLEATYTDRAISGATRADARGNPPSESSRAGPVR